MTQISYEVWLFLDISVENEQLFGLEDSGFHLTDHQGLAHMIWPSFTILFFGHGTQRLNIHYIIYIWDWWWGKGRHWQAVLKDLRVTCAYGHNFLQAPSV